MRIWPPSMRTTGQPFRLGSSLAGPGTAGRPSAGATVPPLPRSVGGGGGGGGAGGGAGGGGGRGLGGGGEGADALVGRTVVVTEARGPHEGTGLTRKEQVRPDARAAVAREGALVARGQEDLGAHG